MFLFLYNIIPIDIRKNQTANHGMNVFVRELLAIFLRKVFTEIHLAINHRRRNILMHKHIVCCNRLAILCVDRHNIHLIPTIYRSGQRTIYNCPYSPLYQRCSVYIRQQTYRPQDSPHIAYIKEKASSDLLS